MDVIVTEELTNILLISITFSIFLMALIQKFKDLAFITKGWQTWILNLIFSFAMGIPFAMNFYGYSLISAVWVGVFGFIGAPTLYEILQKQNLITYKPKSTSENSNSTEKTIEISTENEIKRS